MNSEWIEDLNVRPETINRTQRKKAPCHWPWQQFFGHGTKSKSNKSKNKQMALHQTYKLLNSKGNNKKNEGTTSRI